MAPPDRDTSMSTGVTTPSRTTNTSQPASTTTTTTTPTDLPLSRRTSSAMGPPPLPGSFPSNSNSNSNNSLPNSPRAPSANTAVATGMERTPSNQSTNQSQGPIRHPRPLTAADLHLELEREQESIVNRLTRELSALRAQTASVASTASSTSHSHSHSHSHLNTDILPSLPADTYPCTGANTIGTSITITPTSTRRHRSSSNLSTRSARSVRDGITNTNATSVSGVAAPRDRDREREKERDRERDRSVPDRQSLDVSRPEVGGGSRTSSYGVGGVGGGSMSTSASMGTVYGNSNSSGGGGVGMYRSPSQTQSQSYSQATSPYSAPPSYGYGSGPLPHRSTSTSHSHSRDPSQQSLNIAAGGTNVANETHRSPSFNSPNANANAAARYEEAAVQRAELESVKRENEGLRERVRELEGLLRGMGSKDGEGIMAVRDAEAVGSAEVKR